MTETKPFDYDDAYQLLRLVEANQGLRSFSVQVGDFSLQIEKEASPAAPAQAAPVQVMTIPPAVPEAAPAQAEAVTPAAEAGADEEEVRTSMAGVFYRASAPGEDPFVSVGSYVEVGDTIGIIEVMKLLNTVTATVAGEITAILVDDSQPVQFDQPLVRIRPGAGAEQSS